MHQILGVAAVGVIFGEGARRNGLRGLAKQVVKTWLVASAEVRKGATSLKTEMNQLVSEAKAELDQEKAER